MEVKRGISSTEKPLKSLESLVTVTSKDIDTAYKEADEDAKKMMVQCQGNDSEICKKFLSTKTKDNQESLAEFTLQQNADVQNFKKEVDAVSTVDELKEFLKKKGYSDESISKMDLSNVENVKEAIRTRYKNEKFALIEEMNRKIDGKTSKTDGSADKDENARKIESISNELKNRGKNMSNLIKFNNVVAGYLDLNVTNQNTKESKVDRSSASLFQELNDNDKNKGKTN
jgi:hypothetical protein